jgi:hypothetical protein
MEARLERPDVISKSEFVEAVAFDDHETVHYGGVAWGALTRMSQYRKYARQNGGAGDFAAFYDFPADFRKISWSTEYMQQANKLVADTLPLTADWLAVNEGMQPGLTSRLTIAVASAAERLSGMN